MKMKFSLFRSLYIDAQKETVNKCVCVCVCVCVSCGGQCMGGYHGRYACWTDIKTEAR